MQKVGHRKKILTAIAPVRPKEQLLGGSKPVCTCTFTYSVHAVNTVYDRIDAAATINFSTQFGAATI